MRRLGSLLALLLAATGGGATVETDAPGRPFVRDFASGGSRDQLATQFSSQNWAVAQDADGIVYVASSDGIFEYDGVTWRQVLLRNGSIVRSLAVAGRGRVFAGGIGEVGLLTREVNGTLAYTPLEDATGGHLDGLRDVWRMWPYGDGFVAWCLDRVVVWDGAAFASWPISGNNLPGMVGGRFFHVDAGGTLRVLGDGGLVVAGRLVGHDGERVVVWLELADGRVLVGTRQGHLWQLPAEGLTQRPVDHPRELLVTRFPTEVDGFLEANRLYHGVGLRDGGIALGTMDGGAVVIDGDGRLRHLLDRDAGVPDASVLFLTEDRDGGLWLALYRGLVRAGLEVPFASYPESLGLEGVVEALARRRGHLWAATSRGVFRLDRDRFHRIAGVPSPCWAILGAATADEDPILVGAFDGVYEIVGDAARQVRPSRHAYALAASSQRPGLAWVGHADGVAAVELVNGHWRDRGSSLDLAAEVRSIVEDRDGSLWVGSLNAGAFHLVGPLLDDLGRAAVEHHQQEAGLPVDSSPKLFTDDGTVFATTTDGLHEWNRATRRFEASARLGRATGGIMRAAKDSGGSYWLARYDDFPVRVGSDPSGIKVVWAPFLHLPGSSMRVVLPEGDDACWFGGPSGLFRFQGPLENRPKVPLPSRTVMLREVTVDGRAQPLDGEPVEIASGRLRTVVSWVVPIYGEPDPGRYRHRLEGLDSDWSEWSDRSRVEYAGLPSGHFTFRVEARGLGGEALGTAAIPLVVDPPWYLSWPGFLLWGALTATAILAGAAHRSRHLARDRDRLEREVVARTNDLREHMRYLEEARSELEAFSYSVSHDLRAPLRRLDGFSQALLEDHGSDMSVEGRDLVERLWANARKMTELVDALLGLSRITRHDLMEGDVDLSALAGEIAAELRAGEPGRDVEVAIAPGLVAHGDPRLLRSLLVNLLGNAWKFTARRRGARIEVFAETLADGERCFAVRDNGAGFDPRFAERLFGPFQRLHRETEFPGTGIGLATVQRIVRRHRGRVWADGAPDAGATFRFTLGGSG